MSVVPRTGQVMSHNDWLGYKKKSAGTVLQKVVPGDRLRLECEIIRQKGPVGVGRAVATNQDGKVAVSAELTFMIGS